MRSAISQSLLMLFFVGDPAFILRRKPLSEAAPPRTWQPAQSPATMGQTESVTNCSSEIQASVFFTGSSLQASKYQINVIPFCYFSQAQSC